MTNMSNCNDLGFISISNKDVLDFEICVNHWRILGVKVVHSVYHTLSNLQLYRPFNLHANKWN